VERDAADRMEFYVNDAVDASDAAEADAADDDAFRPFPLLETIPEETEEQLSADRSVSGQCQSRLQWRYYERIRSGRFPTIQNGPIVHFCFFL